MTDSGGLQKEAYFFKKPCVTLRNETEWIELITNNYNILAGADKNSILSGFKKMSHIGSDFSRKLYGDGKAALKIIRKLKELS